MKPKNKIKLSRFKHLTQAERDLYFTVARKLEELEKRKPRKTEWIKFEKLSKSNRERYLAAERAYFNALTGLNF